MHFRLIAVVYMAAIMNFTAVPQCLFPSKFCARRWEHLSECVYIGLILIWLTRLQNLCSVVMHVSVRDQSLLRQQHQLFIRW